jgi:D-alanyl-D-alanine carboxypeptidase/D-alanyl-D-alanine-endopeptidase (penicillin-binding protein 4)
MVMKTLGAERQGRPGKSSDGADVVARYLKEVGAFEEGTVIKNGSGLYDANRVTALATVKLLRAAYRDPAIATEYMAQLAVGGVDGTLHKRFRELREKRLLRAKTGTLEATVALSGYVLPPSGKARSLRSSERRRWQGPAALPSTNATKPSRHLWRTDPRVSEARQNER